LYPAVRDVAEVPFGDPAIVQKYLDRPLLYKNYKFDLRLYVLVTSFQPLECFLYQEGFGRFSSQAFTLKHSELKDNYVHLTNSSIQKNASSVPPPLKGARQSEVGGNKCSLAWLWRELRGELGVDIDLVWKRICECVLKALLCVEVSIPLSFSLDPSLLLSRSPSPSLRVLISITLTL